MKRGIALDSGAVEEAALLGGCRELERLRPADALKQVSGQTRSRRRLAEEALKIGGRVLVQLLGEVVVEAG